MSKNKFSADTYKKRNPAKAKLISKAVRLGVVQYAETFKKLANT